MKSYLQIENSELVKLKKSCRNRNDINPFSTAIEMSSLSHDLLINTQETLLKNFLFKKFNKKNYEIRYVSLISHYINSNISQRQILENHILRG